MPRDTKKHRFGIVDFALIDAGLSYQEAVIVQYVARFEKNKRPCFASIPHIAAELRLSEPSTKRYIRRLIDLGYLQESGKGRGRYLATTRIKLIHNGIKMIPYSDQIDPCDRDQNDPLPIKVLPEETTKRKIPKKELRSEADAYQQFKAALLRR